MQTVVYMVKLSELIYAMVQLIQNIMDSDEFIRSYILVDFDRHY
jgi:hypothetical protein